MHPVRLHTDPAAAEGQVLVVVFLRGGADGLTLVPPAQDDAYRRARPTLAVDSGRAIALDQTFSLHADLRPLMPHFESGSLTIIHGAGSEDETRSHFEAQDFIEHGGATSGGWLARYLRARDRAAAAVEDQSSTIERSGTSVDGRSFVSGALKAVAIGATLPESLRGAPGGAAIESVREFSLGEDEVETMFTERLARLYAHERGALGQAAHDTLEAVKRLRAVRVDDAPPANGANYPDSRFGRGLREIARLIRADVGVVATTIDLDGWDTHFGQNALIGDLMRQFARGLDAFMTDLGVEMSRVTLVALSEFGRRVYENTSLGTDHGLGGVMFTAGAGVRGGRVVSPWPDLSSIELAGPGDVPVGINFRDVVAPILARHSPGIDLQAVFPGHTIQPVGGL